MLYDKKRKSKNNKRESKGRCTFDNVSRKGKKYIYGKRKN